MEFFCGLDVGMAETAICVVDATGKVMLETAVVTDPDAIRTALDRILAACGGSATRQARCRPGCIRNCSSLICRRCAWRPSRFARR